MAHPSNKQIVAVVGLGYVGLPLALAFARSGVTTYGFDVNRTRVKQLQAGLDSSDEISPEELAGAPLIYTTDATDLARATFIIVAVPTPVTEAGAPDLTFLKKASRTVGQQLQKGSIVVYESTVYPGVTREICGPLLEQASGLKLGVDFAIGYSPERINPGDKEHTIDRVVKIVSGMDVTSCATIAATYSLVCRAGVHVASSIKVAEAIKVAENTQRDVNIALVNELSLLFHRLNIDTAEVLQGISTKWNALNFVPGLVGGHCIGVDPYYLIHKAQKVRVQTPVMSAARRINDSMPHFVADQTMASLKQAGKEVKGARILVMGLTFKENVKDVRNSKIKGTIERLQQHGAEVQAYEPLTEQGIARKEFGVHLVPKLSGTYDALIVAVPHTVFSKMERQMINLCTKPAIIIDIKRAFPKLKYRDDIIYRSL